jgi:hypothetical protein
VPLDGGGADDADGGDAAVAHMQAFGAAAWQLLLLLTVVT